MKGCWYRPILGTHMAIEQKGCLSLPHLLWRGILFLWSSPKTCDTHTCCWEFDKWAVTTGYNDIVLSRSRFQPWSPACVVNVLPTEPPWWSYMWRQLRPGQLYCNHLMHTKENIVYCTEFLTWLLLFYCHMI